MLELGLVRRRLLEDLFCASSLETYHDPQQLLLLLLPLMLPLPLPAPQLQLQQSSFSLRPSRLSR
jgi:hypothetical protein